MNLAARDAGERPKGRISRQSLAMQQRRIGRTNATRAKARVQDGRRQANASSSGEAAAKSSSTPVGLAQATRETTSPASGRRHRKQKCERRATNLRQRSDAAMASVPTSPDDAEAPNLERPEAASPHHARTAQRTATSPGQDAHGNRKKGKATPKGDRLTTGTNSEGANPMGGAKVEKTWQVTEAGVQRKEAKRG